MNIKKACAPFIKKICMKIFSFLKNNRKKNVIRILKKLTRKKEDRNYFLFLLNVFVGRGTLYGFSLDGNCF